MGLLRESSGGADSPGVFERSQSNNPTSPPVPVQMEAIVHSVNSLYIVWAEIPASSDFRPKLPDRPEKTMQSKNAVFDSSAKSAGFACQETQALLLGFGPCGCRRHRSAQSAGNESRESQATRAFLTPAVEGSTHASEYGAPPDNSDLPAAG